MIPATALVQHAQESLLLAVTVSAPIVGVAAIVGLIVAAFQAASQVQDVTLAHLPRVLAVTAAIVLLGPWMGHEIASFAERMLLSAIH